MTLSKMGVDLVDNFLNYLLHHDVCPEYTHDILRAKDVCTQALKQIPKTVGLWKQVPGDFNTAARVLYCQGLQHSRHNAMTPVQAKRIFVTTLATMDNAGKFSQPMSVISTVEQAFEIEQLCIPSDDLAKFYRGVKDSSGTRGNIEPCGRVILKPVTIRDGWDIDMDAGPAKGINSQETFMLEEKIIRNLVVGMKLKLVICTLTLGLKFIQEFKQILPTYYTFLPQELMLNYKEPVPDDRQAPSIDDTEAEVVETRADLGLIQH
jgi:hypothetical protein